MSWLRMVAIFGYGSVSDLGEKPHAFNLPGENSGDYSTSV